MKSHLRRIPLILLCLAPASAEPPGIDQSLEFVVPPSGVKFIRWHGKPGRSYFVQFSDPADHLNTWDFAPTVEGGNDEDISYQVDGTADKGFFRLLHTDEPTTDPHLADFDGDGINNGAEVEILHTNPFTANAGLDSDHDGIPDELEMHWYGNLTTMTATSDADGDGILDIYEAQTGSNPQVDQASDPAQRSNYEYDSMGRLTETDGVTYGFDIEGNLETSN